MNRFLDENFLLQTETARKLYHEYAERMPIFDYHCHLPVKDIANDICFDNLSQAWLAGDHYKWRLMRSNGIAEKFCTGDATDYEKFEKWAETVPLAIRNPLYHWTHLELQRYFNISDLLSPKTCKNIYDHCSRMLQSPEFSVRNLLLKMNVKLICTTDDPIDSLDYHKKIKDDGFRVKVLPTFRPDKAMAVNNSAGYNNYISKLRGISGIDIKNFTSLMEALEIRHKYFHDRGCRVADHGILSFYAESYTDVEIEKITNKVLLGRELSEMEISKFKSAFLYEIARLNHKRGWVQQFHVGALRNINTRLFNELGPDIGCDSIGDRNYGEEMARFLDKLDQSQELTKTILYNLNPRDNELIAAMTGNFQDGSFPGKMQFGPSWWFLDQIDGMTKQINNLSNFGLLGRFIGMTTDSRSFLSFPRHEYFRRILCNLIGADVENGEIPSDMNLIGDVIENICYNNAVNYFKLL
ncbi:MAG: glucuronate isomerase [Promethearchaeota archaeon Loki_b32]|nr:MAG: glucuronate isomerase [Candidatus Lokiarchaeota archaeon Loki_b32]